MSTSTNVLIVLDGWGYSENPENNAIAIASTPVWDELWAHCPRTLISGSGHDVGLPDGQMGNSEVGHMNLGAGRIIDQDFTRISKAIEDGSFNANPVLQELTSTLKDNGGALHVFGLLSPGGVHSHEDHLKAAVSMAFSQGVSSVYVHAFLDGRDVPPQSAEASLRSMQSHIESLGNGGIVSVTGRFYAMDRDNRWERVEPAYNLICTGQAEYVEADPLSALKSAYDRGETDEFVSPTAIRTGGEVIQMADGDAVLFMNFRADRAREISRAFVHDQFDGFTRTQRPELSRYVTLTEYASDIDCPVAYAPDSLNNGLGEIIADRGQKQLRIAETEKYAHVTFFFSGGREDPFPGEDRILIPSPRVKTYDLQPTMSAPEVTDKLVAAIESGDYELIVCNFANGDMVGHTGVLQAAVEAVEYLDECLGRITRAVRNVDGHCLITADHGNVEKMQDHSTGQAHTAHTSEPVPLVYVGSQPIELVGGGKLADVAPTMLSLMSIAQPVEMTGRSLIADSIQRTAAN